MGNLGERKTPIIYTKYIAMEYSVNKTEKGGMINALSYEKAAAEFENETKQTEELSCSLQLKNLLMTNLKLLKLNEISAILLF